jgi:hypothetical protein
MSTRLPFALNGMTDLVVVNSNLQTYSKTGLVTLPASTNSVIFFISLEATRGGDRFTNCCSSSSAISKQTVDYQPTNRYSEQAQLLERNVTHHLPLSQVQCEKNRNSLTVILNLLTLLGNRRCFRQWLFQVLEIDASIEIMVNSSLLSSSSLTRWRGRGRAIDI